MLLAIGETAPLHGSVVGVMYSIRKDVRISLLYRGIGDEDLRFVEETVMGLLPTTEGVASCCKR